MPAFDPVRDAVLNSPVDSPGPRLHHTPSPSLARRATHLSVLLNDEQPPQRHQSNIHSLLADDTLASAEPIRRSSMDINHISPPNSRRHSLVESPRPSSAGSLPPRSSASPVVRPPSTIPYNPKRITKANSVLIPLSQDEIELYKSYRGQGVARLTAKRKRALSDEPEPVDTRPPKRHTGDVGVIAEHYNSRPEVGVDKRLESPIIGLKNFNNWVKSVLITRFAHPVLERSSVVGSGTGARRGRGKVLDMGCGKGGDLTKWSKARVGEILCADIAAVSVDQARRRWEDSRGPRFDASFAAIDCYSEPLSKGFAPARLAQPIDVVSMQFCMHYAFESVQKTRCMLDNVSRYLRPGGVFIGTIPNADWLLEQLEQVPPDAEKKAFGNSIYQITFEDREDRPVFGHKYWFYLQDAVDNVPEYIVRWDNFVQMAAEYGLHPKYKEEFHQVFSEHQDHPEFKPLLIRMKVVDAEGESSMDEDQWEAANIYIAFAFEKR